MTDGALAAPPISSSADVLPRLQAVGAALPAADGLGYFNRMYVCMTQALQARLAGQAFSDPQFIERLEVRFVNLYLAVIAASVTKPDAVSKAWWPLVAQRQDHQIAPIQFALAGMNAHINHDLALGIVKACEDVGSGPDAGTHHQDYEAVNAILASIEAQVRQSFEQGEILHLDQQFAGVENVLANWSIETARAAAWTNGEVLWNLRDISALERNYAGVLDRMVGFASRGLLTHV